MSTAATEHGVVKVVSTEVAHYDRSHAAGRPTDAGGITEPVGGGGRRDASTVLLRKGAYVERALGEGGSAVLSSARTGSYRRRTSRRRWGSARFQGQSRIDMPSAFLPWTNQIGRQRVCSGVRGRGLWGQLRRVLRVRRRHVVGVRASGCSVIPLQLHAAQEHYPRPCTIRGSRMRGPSISAFLSLLPVRFGLH